MMGGMGGGGGDMGTLQALLAELSGLKKPRGFFNRSVRRLLGMRPKPPPKYRLLVMMASNMPDSLDPALLRPGRIDRIYKVGYPSKAGRKRTYEGYLSKVEHELTPEQIEKLAVMTPYATGATIKDLVNEALINAIRDGRDTITWIDVLEAKHLKSLGPRDDVELVGQDRHGVAVHEACHAVDRVPRPQAPRDRPRHDRSAATSTWAWWRRSASTTGSSSSSRSSRPTSWCRSRRSRANGSSSTATARQACRATSSRPPSSRS